MHCVAGIKLLQPFTVLYVISGYFLVNENTHAAASLSLIADISSKPEETLCSGIVSIVRPVSLGFTQQHLGYFL